jgi:hypothetical protein
MSEQLPLPGIGRDWRNDAALRRRHEAPPEGNGPIEWTTPPCVRAAAIRFVLPLLRPGLIWEPCPGVGELAQAFRDAGRKVVVTDGNCLDVKKPPHGARIAFTNSPWNELLIIKRKKISVFGLIIDHLLAMYDARQLDTVVLLMRNDHLTAESQRPPHTRIAALQRADREIDCCWRPLWLPGTTGNGRFTCTWVGWGIEPGPTIRVKKEDVIWR